MGALKSKRCTKGHLLHGGNLYLKSNGQRECKKCSLERSKIAYRNKTKNGDK